MTNLSMPAFVLNGYASIIGNQYVTTHHSLVPEKHFSVFNPITHETLAHLHSATANDVEQAISLAAQATTQSPLSEAQRRDLLLSTAACCRDQLHELATLLSLESGKTISDATAEIEYGISYLDFYAEQAQSLAEPERSDDMLIYRRPVGVVAAITPWNFPNAMILRKAAIALACGCPFIVKPSESTPLSALAIGELMGKAGWPAGWFAVLVTDHAKELGQVLTTDSRIAKFTFTGSTEVGKKLNAQCASTLKRVSLELGGNAPFLVTRHADIDMAVGELVKNKQRNMGQVCVAANRIYVAEAHHDEFVAKLCEALGQLTAGSPMATDTQIGSMIHSKAASKIAALVEHAQAQGAQRVYGSDYQAGSAYHDHTVLTNVRHDDDICQQEIFGPVFPIIQVSSDAIADWLKLANDTLAGLVAYAFSQNEAECQALQHGLRYGMCGINSGAISNAAAPFGGIKQSGFGREGGTAGLADYTAMQYIKIGN